MRPTKVLFIGGYGRSGSTLLDRMLGQTDGFFSAGELRHLWREGLIEDRRCGCGEPFSRCTLWQEVLSRAYPEGIDRTAIRRLQARVDRFFRIPSIALGAPAGFRRDRDRYLHLLEKLYRALADVTGARVIVDSSKDVSHGWLLSRADVDLTVVHLVRDSRAAAYSWQRGKFNPGSGTDTRRYPAVRSAVEWNTINMLTRSLRRTGVTSTVVRYDDLVTHPATTASRLVELTGETGVPPVDGNHLHLQPNHMVAGNPNRFATGRVTIRADERWRNAMPASSRAVVSLLTLPSLRHYGFR